VNDSKKCVELCEKWIQNERATTHPEVMRSVARDRQALEDEAAKMLAGVGFIVHRVAGRFDYFRSMMQA